MTKRELIDEIVAINHTATPAFLAKFSDDDLDEYLAHLRILATPRLSGDASRYERYFLNCPTIPAPRPAWRTRAEPEPTPIDDDLPEDSDESEPEHIECLVATPAEPVETELDADEPFEEQTDADEQAAAVADDDPPGLADVEEEDLDNAEEQDLDEDEEPETPQEAPAPAAVPAGFAREQASAPLAAGEEDDSESWLY